MARPAGSENRSSYSFCLPRKARNRPRQVLISTKVSQDGLDRTLSSWAGVARARGVEMRSSQDLLRYRRGTASRRAVRTGRGVVEEQVTATATPGIDCPDPGRGGTNAYEVARAGGTHSGYLRQAEGFSDINLHRALRSYELQVAYHAGKIANPSGQLLDTPWDIMDSDEQRRVLTDWCTDLGRNRELADVILGILRERGISP